MNRYLTNENIIDLMCKACDKIEVIVNEPPSSFIKRATSYSVDRVPMQYIARDVISLINSNEVLTCKWKEVSNTLDKALSAASVRSDNTISLLLEAKKIVDEVKRVL